MNNLEKALNQPEQKHGLADYTENYKLEMAIHIIASALEKDKGPNSYYDTWKANIAMSFVDAWNSDLPISINERRIAQIANNAAENFLNQLCSEAKK